jgi:DNA-binding NtrC family response regulator
MVAKQILVAEDDALIRDLIQTLLSREGYKIDEAENGLQAVAWMNVKAYDLILSDIQMPHIDGMRVLEEAQRLHPTTRVILMSAGIEVDQDQLLAQGAFDFIQKPFTLESFIERIERGLETLEPNMHESVSTK